MTEFRGVFLGQVCE